MENKKEVFKLLIKEFHESRIPMIIRRDLSFSLESNKITTVSGPRRAGKTYFFYQLINELKETIPLDRIVYINFEDDRILPLSFQDLQYFMEAYYELFPENKDKQLYLFLDEIQNITKWELFIRRIYDKEKVTICITGSSSKLLSKEISTSLRGRTLAYKLFPLNFKEFLRFKNIQVESDSMYTKLRYEIKKLLDEYITFGGFPEVVLADENLKYKILRSYYDLSIYKDLVERFSIRNINLLKNLLKYLLTNIATIFSINSYYKSIEPQLRVSRETIIEYIAYLEDIELIYLIPTFSYSLKVQQVNPRKLYAIDNGIRNAVSFRFSKDEGRLVENVIFQELFRRGYDTYYFKGKQEIDFVIPTANRIICINASYGKEINEREYSSLVELRKQFNDRAVAEIIITKDTEKKIKRQSLIPLWKWLLFNSEA